MGVRAVSSSLLVFYSKISKGTFQAIMSLRLRSALPRSEKVDFKIYGSCEMCSFALSCYLFQKYGKKDWWVRFCSPPLQDWKHRLLDVWEMRGVLFYSAFFERASSFKPKTWYYMSFFPFCRRASKTYRPRAHGHWHLPKTEINNHWKHVSYGLCSFSLPSHPLEPLRKAIRHVRWAFSLSPDCFQSSTRGMHEISLGTLPSYKSSSSQQSEPSIPLPWYWCGIKNTCRSWHECPNSDLGFFKKMDIYYMDSGTFPFPKHLNTQGMSVPISWLGVVLKLFF